MPSPIQREEILDYVTYNEQRDAFRKKILAIKEDRRIHLGPYLTFLFENRDTIRYQIQEMMRVEHIVKEVDILHEIKTYNGLLHEKGGLGCTLMLEIDDPEERNVKLKEWLGLPEALYIRLESGRTVFAQYDSMQVGEDRLSSVQYLKFDAQGQPPVAIGVNHPKLTLESELTPVQKQALMTDINSD